MSVLHLTAGLGEPTYTLPVNCSNCGWSGEAEIAKGRSAPSHLVGGPDARLPPTAGRRTRCPNCGCLTVGKSGNTRPTLILKGDVA